MIASERITTVSPLSTPETDLALTGQFQYRLRRMRHPAIHPRKAFHRHVRLRTK